MKKSLLVLCGLFFVSVGWCITVSNPGSGTVTDVTATAPLTSTGGTTPAIALPASADVTVNSLTAGSVTSSGTGAGSITLNDTAHTGGTILKSSGTVTGYISYTLPSSSATALGYLRTDANNMIYPSVLPAGTHIAQGTFDLSGWYDIDTQIWLFDLDTTAFPYGILISSITLDCSVTDPTTEFAGDLKYCDAVGAGAFPGGSPTVIVAMDTTTGNYSSGTISSSVATAKTVYIDMDSDPTDANIQWHLKVTYTVKEN